MRVRQFSVKLTGYSACPDLTFITVSVDNPKYDSRDNSNAIIETSSNTLLSGCKNTVIPISVTNIGDNAFSNCYGLTSIDIPNGVTSIGDFAFYGCTGLTSIVIPSSVTSIGNYAFWDCIFLRVVLNYSSLDIWKGSKENGCVASYAYIVLNNVDGIVDDFVFTENDGQYYLSACLRGDSVLSLPEHYKNKGYGIGDSVFCNRNELIAITIPKGVTSIKSKSFSGCLALTSIDIPHTVTQIEPGAFSDCSGLTSITVSVDNPKYDSRDNSNAIIETSSNTLLSGCKNTVIPASVTNIGDNAFEGCYGLTSIDIPNGVTRIGNNAFSGCYNLTSVTIPASVTSIGEAAFENCI